MARKSFVLLVVGTIIFFLCSVSSADVPSMINYQGKLTTAQGGCLNDTVSMTFTIYSDDQGTVQDWTEDQDSVIVKEGIFNVLLGSVNALHDTMFDEATRYLGVQVESDPEMRPLKPMVTVPYAFRVSTVDGARGGTIYGDVNIEGDVIITGDTIYVGDITIEPTTRYLSIPPTEFQQLSEGEDDAWLEYHETHMLIGFYGDGRRLKAAAPIQLPHGAIISEVVFYYKSSEHLDSVFVKVGRSPLFEAPDSLETLGSAFDDSPGNYHASLTISSFSDSTIDNTSYCYSIVVDVDATSTQTELYHARIEYVIDKPLP